MSIRKYPRIVQQLATPRESGVGGIAPFSDMLPPGMIRDDPARMSQIAMKYGRSGFPL
jgi:hypothetical protein